MTLAVDTQHLTRFIF